MRYGILGGGFNPPHIAHVMGAAYAITAFDLDILFVSPCWDHPFEDKEPMVSWEHRAEMCNLAFSGLRNVKVPQWERDLQPHYTVDLLEKVIPTLSGTPHLILGSDNIEAQSKWRRWGDVMALVHWHLITLPRGTGFLPDISSTQFRSHLKNKTPQPCPEGIIPIPHKVAQYIREHNLYV